MISRPLLDGFTERLGHTFSDPALLTRALTHRSWCAEHPEFESNERMEFLGDAVLGLVVTDEVFRRFPDVGEGVLSRSRAAVVRADALAEMAASIGVGSVLLLGKGEELTGGRDRPSILADAMEALIGATYLDGGLDAARRLVVRILAERLDGRGDQDAKSRLHELVARRERAVVSYRISERGLEHDKHFCAVVLVGDHPCGEGTGRTKKQAEQAAARAALLRLVTPTPEHRRVAAGAREGADDG